MTPTRKPWTLRPLRLPLIASLAALCLFSVLAASAAAAPRTATDWFVGHTPAGQASPIQIDPTDVTFRADAAVGIGYAYRATGEAAGQVPGSFTYEEHGYLYFANPSDPTSMVGSKFTSGVFTLQPVGNSGPIKIADTSPETYRSGIQTLIGKLNPQTQRVVGQLLGTSGALTFGYFTFTNAEGTFIGYATPDFTRFAIQITFQTT